MKIWDLFAGYEKACGQYDIRRTDERGKVQGKALTIHEPATRKHWKVHLDGSGNGLGIIPLRADNTVKWAAIDIDDLTINHKELIDKINDRELPLVVARSKSGGAHCFIFLEEPAPAAHIRKLLANWASVLGYGGCEIFPKQIDRYSDIDTGNWLNMPYYNYEKTIRFGFNKKAEELDLEQFEKYASSRVVKFEDLSTIEVQSNGYFSDGPPCLQVLHAGGGFPEGTRNEGMYNVCVYLRRKYPDDWKRRVQSANVDLTNPPLDLQEIENIVRSVSRRDYTYKCRQPPISAHCDRTLCLTRDFGIGEMAEGGGRPEIGHLVKHAGEPVIWFADVNGHRIMLTTDELLSQNRFKRKVAEAINRVPVSIPQARWDRYVDEKLQHCDVVEVPEDASPTGQFRFLVDQYTTGMAQATNKDELAHRLTPYRTDDGEVWFRSRALLDYLNNHGFKPRSEHHVWQMLRDMGAKTKFIRASNKSFNVWVIPAPEMAEDTSPLPPFGTEEF